MKENRVRINLSFPFLTLTALISLCSNTAFISLISITVHELSHIAAIIWVGVSVSDINLKLSEIKIRQSGIIGRKDEVIVAISGPASNLLLSFISFLFENTGFLYINLILFSVNMLPVYPFDGSFILSFINSERLKKFIVIVISILISLLGLILSIYSKKNISLLILGLIISINSFMHPACK